MSGKDKGVLYLVPSSLGEEVLDTVWPSGHKTIVQGIDVFIVENLRTARRFLKRAGYEKNFDEVDFHLLNKHTQAHEIHSFLDAAGRGRDVGMLSEAGCPCIADPGQQIVALAHQRGITVKPLTGPSSIMLALMASGMNGQAFCFHAYLPIHKKDRIKKIKALEEAAKQSGATQIFMETPFRNDKLVEDLLKHCYPDTMLCLAADLTSSAEYIRTKSIGEWRKSRPPGLHKRPAIFLLWR